MAQREAGFPPSDFWMPAVPLLPLVLATLLLAPLIDPTAELNFLGALPGDFIAEPARSYVHLGDILTYGALSAVHSLLCLGVIAAFAAWIARLPAGQRRGALVFLAIGVALIGVYVAVLLVAADRTVLVQLGYKAVCQLLAAAELPTRLVGTGQCFEAGHISALTWLAWVPTFAGMATVAVAAAYAYGAARGLPPLADNDESLWRAALDRRVKALQRGVYLLSAVLVSSTITITVFARLPTALLTAGDPPALADAVSAYAAGLGTFWGALFSATLAAAFLAPALGLVARAYGGSRPAGVAPSADLAAWLHDHLFQSLKRQLATAFSLLAPLLVGPLSSLISGVSGL